MQFSQAPVDGANLPHQGKPNQGIAGVEVIFPPHTLQTSGTIIYHYPS